MDRYIIDRFEDDIVVCEMADGSMTEVMISLVPNDAHEGDSLLPIDGKYVIDHEFTAKKREQIKKRMNKLFE